MSTSAPESWASGFRVSVTEGVVVASIAILQVLVRGVVSAGSARVTGATLEAPCDLKRGRKALP